MKKNNYKIGFTLIEMTVTVCLVGVLVLLLSGIFSNGLRSYRVGQKRVNYNEKCAKVILDFEKNTRGATSILESDSDRLTFLAYSKGDIHPAPSKVSYYLEGDTFYRSQIAPVASGASFIYPEDNKEIIAISSDVLGGDFFQYFNETGAALAEPVQKDSIRMISISVFVDENVNAMPEAAFQKTNVQLRNLKTNF